MDRFDSVPETALEWHRQGKRIAIATVAQTWGSAPRRVGSQLVVSANAEMEGSVSGGCVEGAVVTEAIDAIADGQARMLEYGVTEDDAFAAGLACGGIIRIWLEPIGSSMPVSDLEAIVQARTERKPIGYEVNTITGARQLIGPSDVEDRFRADKSGMDEDGERLFTIHNPPLRLVVVGGVHIAQALVPMARIAGYDPIIVDPREAFASDARFPGVQLVHEWPDEALDALGPDPRTAVVLLTHDPKLDDPAIHTALRSDVFYIGALGSRKTQAKRIERLKNAGFTEADLARIHGPVGLAIGSSGPAEIAVSILAEMTSVLRKGS